MKTGFMAIKMQKAALLKVFQHAATTKFNEKRADMFDRVINSFNGDTWTRLDFTEITKKFHL